MRRTQCLFFAVLLNSLNSFGCVCGQSIYGAQLPQQYVQLPSGYGGGNVAPIAYTYGGSPGLALSPQPLQQLNPTTTQFQYGLSILPTTTAQYQYFPYTQSQALLFPSNGFPGTGYQYPLLGTRETLVEQPLATPSLTSGILPLQGSGGSLGGLGLESGVPVTNVQGLRLPPTNQFASSPGQVMNPSPPLPPPSRPLPIYVTEDYDEEEEEIEEEQTFDAVLSALMAQAHKNGQTVHSDRYTYGRSEPLVYEVASEPRLEQARSPLYYLLERGLIKQRRPQSQHVIKKPFHVKLPHHFEFYDWH